MPAKVSATPSEAFQIARDSDGPINERLETYAATLRTMNRGASEAIDHLVGRLKGAGAGSNAPKVGEPLPPFLLPDDSANLVSLEGLLAKGPVAIAFHRGHWCPYCRININALAQAQKELTKGEGRIIGIMPDLQKFVAELKKQSNVPFPILSDMDNGYALSLNLTIWVGAELQRMLQDRVNIPAFQGNSSWMLPIPATFVVGRDGLIRARFIDPDYRKRMTITEMLAAMRS